MWLAGGAASGAAMGLVSSGFRPPAPNVPAKSHIMGQITANAGTMAGVAAVFAVSDTLLTQARGHSVVNSAVAGCAAGAALGLQQGSPSRAFYACGLFGMIQLFGGMGVEHSGGGGH